MTDPIRYFVSVSGTIKELSRFHQEVVPDLYRGKWKDWNTKRVSKDISKMLPSYGISYIDNDSTFGRNNDTRKRVKNPLGHENEKGDMYIIFDSMVGSLLGIFWAIWAKYPTLEFWGNCEDHFCENPGRDFWMSKDGRFYAFVLFNEGYLPKRTKYNAWKFPLIKEEYDELWWKKYKEYAHIKNIDDYEDDVILDPSERDSVLRALDNRRDEYVAFHIYRTDNKVIVNGAHEDLEAFREAVKSPVSDFDMWKIDHNREVPYSWFLFHRTVDEVYRISQSYAKARWGFIWNMFDVKSYYQDDTHLVYEFYTYFGEPRLLFRRLALGQMSIDCSKLKFSGEYGQGEYTWKVLAHGKRIVCNDPAAKGETLRMPKGYPFGKPWDSSCKKTGLEWMDKEGYDTLYYCDIFGEEVEFSPDLDPKDRKEKLLELYHNGIIDRCRESYKTGGNIDYDKVIEISEEVDDDEEECVTIVEDDDDDEEECVTIVEDDDDDDEEELEIPEEVDDDEEECVTIVEDDDDDEEEELEIPEEVDDDEE